MENIKTLEIPFFFGVQDDQNNGGLPFSLPFKYYFDKQLNLYRQFSDENLRQILKEIYLKGSMLNGEMNVVDGGHQGRAALEFIYQNVEQINGLRVLEIGCGNGFILKELTKRGAICVGLEPGPQINDANAIEGIQLINDFFPSEKITGEFDFILHFNVLEHLENPVDVLIEQAKILKPEGKIIFGIPNCEPNLSTGDLSIFAHEHFNYFTRDSIFHVSKHAGLYVDSIATGASDGMIFCSLVKNSLSSRLNYIDSKTQWDDFDSKVEGTLRNLKNTLENYKTKDVAVYCPKRALNALSILHVHDCRIIDDTIDMYGKYLPSFNNPVENRESLAARAPDVLIVFSRTFGHLIKEKCRSLKELDKTEILLLEEFDQ